MKGIALERKKQQTLLSWAIRAFKNPSRVLIPVSKIKGHPTKILCSPGQTVKEGEVLAQPEDETGVFVHASIGGEVRGIVESGHPLWGRTPCIEIDSRRGSDAPAVWGAEDETRRGRSLEEYRGVFRKNGLVTLDFEMAPLHQKIMDDDQLSKDTLIVNGCESEPYITSVHALMMSHPLETLKGIEILRGALRCSKVLILVEEDQLEAAELLKSKIYLLRWVHYEVRILSTRYPQDMPPLFFSALVKEESPVYNIPTVFAVYEAVLRGKPLIERSVTVGGGCVLEPKNLWVRLGTDFEELIKQCRGLLREPQKIIMGGPMRGAAQSSIHVPVIEAASAVLALPHEIVNIEEAEPCIRCGRCDDACPRMISPMMIALAAELTDPELAVDYGSDQCIFCGNCAYVCPAKRPMLDLIYSTRRPDNLKPV